MRFAPLLLALAAAVTAGCRHGFEQLVDAAGGGPGGSGSDGAITCTSGCDSGTGARRIKLSITNPAAEALLDFPMLVRLNASRIDYADTQDAGQDLRFVDADGTALAHEIERWDEQGTSEVWVRVPRVEPSTTTDYFWLYYRDPAASDGQNRMAVWTAAYALVYHFEEDPSGAAPQVLDSTSFSNHGTSAGSMAANALIAGPIGRALAFDGNNDWLSAANDPSIELSAEVSITWFARRSGNATQYVCDMESPGSEAESDNHLYELYFESDNSLTMEWEFGGGNNAIVSSTAPTATAPGVWSHYAATRDVTANQVRFYENGGAVGAAVSYGTDPSGGTQSTFWLAGHTNSSKNPLAGAIDEFRLARAVRSPAWIRAEYLAATDTMLAYGLPESL